MQVPINLTGGSYSHKSLPLSAQVTRNWWPQLQKDGGVKGQYILESWPGLTSFATGTNANRGLFAHNGVLYQVEGNNLDSIDSAGNRTNLGALPGAGRCRFDALVDSVIIVTGGRVFEWDGTNLTEGTASQYETPNAVAVLNNQAIYDGNDSRFCVSNVGTPLTVNALNYGSAESRPDEIVRPYAFNQVAYMFGESTIEPFWNSGEGQPPFDRLEGGIINVGLRSIDSTANNQRNLYFLGSDSQVYVLQENNVLPITPQPITRTIDNYSDSTDAIGWCMNYQGQEFYILTFPSANQTWAYPEGGQWFELSSGVLGGKYSGEGYAYCYGKHLLVDSTSNVYYLNDSTYSENGAVIQRTRDSAVIHGGLFGLPGRKITMNSLELIMETGVGDLTTTDPKIMMSYSDDGGKTFSTERQGSVGSMGQFQKRVRWHSMGQFRERIIRIRTSDPVYYSIHLATAEIEVGI